MKDDHNPWRFVTGFSWQEVFDSAQMIIISTPWVAADLASTAPSDCKGAAESPCTKDWRSRERHGKICYQQWPNQNPNPSKSNRFNLIQLTFWEAKQSMTAPCTLGTCGRDLIAENRMEETWFLWSDVSFCVTWSLFQLHVLCLKLVHSISLSLPAGSSMLSQLWDNRKRIHLQRPIHPPDPIGTQLGRSFRCDSTHALKTLICQTKPELANLLI